MGTQGEDQRVQLFWGIAADGSVVISDNKDVIKASCAKSFAPFPPGMFSTRSFTLYFLYMHARVTPQIWYMGRLRLVQASVKSVVTVG